VREDYQKLVDELGGLARALGETLPADAVLDAGTLIAAVDSLDRVLDAADDRGRAALRRSTVATLRGEPGSVELRELVELIALHRLLRARTIIEPFVDVAIAALANTEQMRRTRSVGEYIALSRREGVLLVDMTLLVLGRRAGPALSKFLYAVSGPANLWDKLRDARADHANGELAIRPGVALHAHILTKLLAGVPAVVRAHPRPAALVRWAARWW
jgi:hypothetical protein